MAEPFWKTTPLQALEHRTVRVTYRDHSIVHGTLALEDPEPPDPDRTLALLIGPDGMDDWGAARKLSVIIMHADGTREIADPDIASVMLEQPGRITRVVRVDDPAQWEAGDIIVLKDGGEWTVTDPGPGTDGTIKAVYPMLGIRAGIPKAYVDHALRPRPYLPDWPGLWRSLVDDALYVAAPGENGLMVRAIRDARGDWTNGEAMPADGGETARLAPFIHVDGTLPGDWIAADPTEQGER